MPLDPNIILGIGDLNNPDRAAQAKLNALKVMSAQQEMKGQNALRQMFADPQNFDPSTGGLTPNALRKVGAEGGADFYYTLAQNNLNLQKTQAELTDKYMGMIDDAGLPAALAYDSTLKSTGSKEAAQKAAQTAWDSARKDLTTSGHLPGEIADKLPNQFNPDLFKAKSKQYQAFAKEQLGEEKEKFMEGLDLAKLSQGQERINIQVADKGGGSGVMTDQDMHDMAEQYLAGDKSVLQGMGYGSKGAANRARLQHMIRQVAREQGMSGADVANKIAEFSGETAGQRTLGTRSANMEIAANEVKNMAPLALAASEKVDRTKFPNLNSILLAAEKGTGDENVVQFGLAANSLIYTYSKFLNPTGIPTDADKARATEILSTAWSKGQFKAAINQIHKEISSGLSALKTTKQEIHVDSGTDRETSVPGMPKQGEVQKGYRFKGGDPSKKESWEKVQ